MAFWLDLFTFRYRVTQLKVVVGQVSLTTIDSGEQSFSVLTSLNHPSYDASTKENNIAMLAVIWILCYLFNYINQFVKTIHIVNISLCLNINI